MTFFMNVILPGAAFFLVLWGLLHFLPEGTALTNDFSGVPPLDKAYEKELLFHKKMREARKKKAKKRGTQS